jgi:hypothetical protein
MIPRIALSALLAPYRAKPGTATGFPSSTAGRRGDADGLASAPPPGPPPLRRHLDFLFNSAAGEFGRKSRMRGLQSVVIVGVSNSGCVGEVHVCVYVNFVGGCI